jgi:UDP-4-amino-4,6-dideoxy-N-acetyl-beta-L-altrosamine N-acetyltransferase
MFVEGVDPLIRPMQAEDLDAVWKWRNQWRVRRYMFNQSEISRNEHQEWYESACADPFKHLLIFEANGIPAGFVGFYESPSGRIADWGFYTAEGAPKGYGRLLCSSAVRFGFSSIGLHKICGRVLDYNHASLNLHKQLGFTLEGTLRDSYFDGDQYHAVHYFGLLRREQLT